MTKNIRHVTLVAVSALALGLGACGGDDKPATEPPRGDIDEQVGFSDEGIEARQVLVEAEIRTCMRNEGFDYTPVDPAAARAAITGQTRLSDDAFLQQYGYGISTLWGRGRGRRDPNEAIRSSLSEADRKAYDRALGGDHPGNTFAAAVDNGDFASLGGCTKKATAAVFGGAEVLDEITARLEELDERIAEDQRIAKAIENWSACMADKGLRYDEPEAIDEDLFSRMEDLVGSLPGQFATGPKPGERANAFDPADLRALQREEVEIARADFACEEEHITPVEEKVEPGYQEEFQRANQALIRRIKPAPAGE